MADTAPKKITTIDDFLSLAVPEKDRPSVVEALRSQNFNQANEMLKGYASGYEARGGSVSLPEVLENSLSLYNQTPQPPPQATTSPSAPKLGLSGAFAGAGTGNYSKTSRILDDLNADKIDFERDTYVRQIQDALESGHPDEALEYLKKLQPNQLLDAQVGRLYVRAREAGADQKTLDLITAGHEKIKATREGKKEKDDTEEFLEMLKTKSPEEQKDLLEKRFTQQHSLRSTTGGDLTDITTKRGFLGLGKRSIFSRQVQRELLKRGDAEGRERNKGAKTPEKQLSPEETEPFPGEREPGEDLLHAPEGLHGVPPLTEGLSGAGATLGEGTGAIATATSGTAAGLTPEAVGGGAMFTNPYVIGGIVVGLVIIVIIIILFNLNNSSCTFNCPVPVTQIACNNVQYGSQLGTGTKPIFDATKNYFQVNFIDNTKSSTYLPDKQDVRFAQALYGTVCILLGLSQPGASKGQFNTFGQLLTGINLHPGQYDPPTITLQDDPTVVDSAGNITCDSSYDPSPNRLIIANPEACLATGANPSSPNPASLASPRLQFIVAKSLTYALLHEQAKLTGQKAKVLNQFETVPNDTGIIGLDGILPTGDCQNGLLANHEYLWPSLGLTQDADIQQQNCFADMVGEYLTYPFYLDPGSPMPNLTPTPRETLTPTPSHALPVNLTDFPKGKYKDYYSFAYANLFGYDMFNAQGYTQCPTAPKPDVAGIQQDLKSLYSVTLMGDVGANKSDALAKAVSTWNTICLMALSPVTKQALFTPGTSAPIAIYWNDSNNCANDSSSPKGNSANICNNHGVNEDCVQSGAYCKDDSLNRMNIGHELGHVFSWRRPDIFQNFCTTVFNGHMGSGDDSWECVWQSNFQKTSIPKTIPTYSCLYDYTKQYCDSQGVPCWGNTSPTQACPNKCTGPFGSECFADTVGEYMTFSNIRSLPFNPPQGSTMDGHALAYDFKEFPTLYSSYYNFAAQQIYGGINYGVTTSASTLAGYAVQLVQAYKNTASCLHSASSGFAYLNKNDASCIPQAAPLLGAYAQGAIDTLTASISPSEDNFFAVQCVAFVRSVAAGIGAPFRLAYGLASEYMNGQPGYTVIHRTNPSVEIQPGDIVVYGNNGSNHIAVVTKILSTGSHTIFELAEGNGGTHTYCADSKGFHQGCLGTANDDTLNPDISGWLRKQ